MFSCRSYIVLPIISIILIISIIILVLYKNHTDKLSNTEPFEGENTVTTTTDQNRADTNQIKSLIDNHIENNKNIKNLKNNLNNQYIKSIYDNYLEKLFNKNEISTIFNNNISNAVEANTNNLIDNNEQSFLMEDNITNLKNKLSDLENITNKLKINKIEQNKYSKIKSLNNGQEFCLKQTPKTNFVNPQTGYLTGGYMVNMNDGCLSVGASDYNVYKCNDENQKHLFKMNHIINEQDYERNIDKTVPFDNVDKTKINYPFTLIKSVNNNDCLTNKNGNVTVQPCNSFVAQRWIPL
jgi:hypothetical protein